MTLIDGKLSRFLGLLFIPLILSSCDTPSRQFDSGEWKAGNASVRGGMVEDLRGRNFLNGKSRTEVEALLGKPDYQQSDWYGYKVITIARCRYFWECRMEVSFDRTSGKVWSVVVSD